MNSDFCVESQAQRILALMRAIVSRVTESDLSETGPEDKLGLDSINRIVLIAEIENELGIELAEGDLSPESFDTLAALATAVQERAG